MALKLMTLMEDGLGTAAKAIVADTAEDYKLLQAIMHRATNLWPDAPASVKALSDMVTNGKVLQEYRDIPTDSNRG